MSNKTGLSFLSDFLLHHYSDLLHYKSIPYYVDFFKKSRKNKSKTIYPKNYENFKNSKPIKKECIVTF